MFSLFTERRQTLIRCARCNPCLLACCFVNPKMKFIKSPIKILLAFSLLSELFQQINPINLITLHNFSSEVTCGVFFLFPRFRRKTFFFLAGGKFYILLPNSSRSQTYFFTIFSESTIVDIPIIKMTTFIINLLFEANRPQSTDNLHVRRVFIDIKFMKISRRQRWKKNNTTTCLFLFSHNKKYIFFSIKAATSVGHVLTGQKNKLDWEKCGIVRRETRNSTTTIG